MKTLLQIFGILIFSLSGFANSDFEVKVKVEAFDSEVLQELKAKYQVLSKMSLQEYRERLAKKDQVLIELKEDFNNFIKSAPIEIFDYQFPKNERGGYKSEKDFSPDQSSSTEGFPLLEQVAMERLALILSQKANVATKIEVKKILSLLNVLCPDKSNYPIGLDWNANTIILGIIFAYNYSLRYHEELFDKVHIPVEENDRRLIGFLMKRFAVGNWAYHVNTFSQQPYRDWGKTYHFSQIEMTLPKWVETNKKETQWWVAVIQFDTKPLLKGETPFVVGEYDIKTGRNLAKLKLPLQQWLTNPISSNLLD